MLTNPKAVRARRTTPRAGVSRPLAAPPPLLPAAGGLTPSPNHAPVATQAEPLTRFQQIAGTPSLPLPVGASSSPSPTLSPIEPTPTLSPPSGVRPSQRLQPATVRRQNSAALVSLVGLGTALFAGLALSAAPTQHVNALGGPTAAALLLILAAHAWRSGGALPTGRAATAYALAFAATTAMLAIPDTVRW